MWFIFFIILLFCLPFFLYSAAKNLWEGLAVLAPKIFVVAVLLGIIYFFA